MGGGGGWDGGRIVDRTDAAGGDGAKAGLVRRLIVSHPGVLSTPNVCLINGAEKSLVGVRLMRDGRQCGWEMRMGLVVVVLVW